ncbi:MAG: hypothetical protein ABSD46_06185 [Bacteroidota bacterium]
MRGKVAVWFVMANEPGKIACLVAILCFYCLLPASARSKTGVRGNRTDSGPDVTVTDNGSTVVLDNGIVTATIEKLSTMITNLTYDSTNLLSGGYKRGRIYWSWNNAQLPKSIGMYIHAHRVCRQSQVHTWCNILRDVLSC